MQTRWKTSVSVAATLVVVLLGLLCPPASAGLGDETASEIVNTVKATVRKVHSFRTEINILRQDPRFMSSFFPGQGDSGVGAIRGVLTYDTTHSGCTMYAQIEGIDYFVFPISESAVVFSGQQRIANLMQKPKLLDSLDMPVEPSPSPSLSPSASPSPEPSPSPSADFLLTGVRSWITDLTKDTVTSVEIHPLLFVVPFELRGISNSSTYTIVSRKSQLMGYDCCILSTVLPKARNYDCRIWICRKNNHVLQVEMKNRDTGTKIMATYLGFFAPDNATNYSIYNRVKVEVNDAPLFIAELSNPEINPSAVLSVEKVSTTSTDPGVTQRLRRASQYITEEVAPFLSKNLLNLVIALCVILAIFFIRYLKFAVSRQEFSDELMVIDEEGGRCIEVLDKLGYKVTPFSAEALAAERELLGKGATKDTTARPRALVVASESFAEVKNYLFLIRAYVQEGGRVLVFYHSAKSISTLPFSPEYLPLPNQNVGVTFSHNLNILPGISDDDLKPVAATYTGRETFLKINDRRLKLELVTAQNKATEIKSVVVGVARDKKGEYLVSQIKLDSEATLRSKPAQLLLNDIVRYLLGLEPIPYNEEETSMDTIAN